MKKVLIIIAIIIIVIIAIFVLTKSEKEPTNTDINTDIVSDESRMLQLSVTIQNSIPDTQITELYLSGAGLDDWGDELLSGQQIDTNQQIQLVLNVDSKEKAWDIKATDETGTPVEFRNLDFSKLNTEEVVIVLQLDESGAPVALAQ